MKCFLGLILATLVSVPAHADSNDDMFNFYETRDATDYGPTDWNRVRCDDPDHCLGFPDPWSTAVGWNLLDKEYCEVCVDKIYVYNNNCKSCPATGDCGQTRQSPIGLFRDRGLLNNPESKECPDWHHMKYQEGACTWEDLVDNNESIHRNNFLIRRHALQILTPVGDDGELKCYNASLDGRRYPRIDFSKGFPNFFHLAHTEISVPSQHVQEGKRYDGEVSLAHFYETDFPEKNQLGKVNIFLKVNNGTDPWPYLDKLICQWRETEEQVRQECGLDSVKTFYPGCSNYDRGLSPSTSNTASSSPGTTDSPSTTPTSHTPKVYPVCNVCGSYNLTVTQLNVTVQIPNFPNLTCEELEEAGKVGLISPDLCANFSDYVSSCKCEVKKEEPTPSPTTPPDYDCPSFSGVINGIDVSYHRICNSCCDPDKRSDTDFCHDVYAFFDNDVPSVCYHCCDDKKIVAPATAPTPLFKEIDCSEVANPHRMCDLEAEKSCCRSPRSDSQYCKDTYSTFGDLMDSVCWYCCSEPRLLGPPLPDNNRSLRTETKGIKPDLEWPKKDTPARRLDLLKRISELDEDKKHKLARAKALRHPIADARVHYMKVPPGSDENNDSWDNDKENFSRTMERHLLNENVVKDPEERSRRRLVNYEDVSYASYEWLLKVRTEYYFRYEGTMTVPPCKDQANFRVMKDPILVPQSQIDELERLLVERIAPKDSKFKSCEPDHAGAPRSGSSDKFDFVRPLQQNHKLHRMVFCECKDWESPFIEDNRWCKLGIRERFYDYPYNFDTGGSF